MLLAVVVVVLVASSSSSSSFARAVSYKLQEYSTCDAVPGWGPLTSTVECSAAASALSLADTSASEQHGSHLKAGCTITSGWNAFLRYNPSTAATHACSSSDKCLCALRVSVCDVTDGLSPASGSECLCGDSTGGVVCIAAQTGMHCTAAARVCSDTAGTGAQGYVVRTSGVCSDAAAPQHISAASTAQ